MQPGHRYLIMCRQILIMMHTSMTVTIRPTGAQQRVLNIRREILQKIGKDKGTCLKSKKVSSQGKEHLRILTLAKWKKIGKDKVNLFERVKVD